MIGFRSKSFNCDLQEFKKVCSDKILVSRRYRQLIKFYKVKANNISGFSILMDFCNYSKLFCLAFSYVKIIDEVIRGTSFGNYYLLLKYLQS